MAIKTLLTFLHKEYKNPKTELENWENTAQFMACVILSAQATDKSVNKITPALFIKYRDLEDFSKANLEELEKAISSINYYKTKAKRIIEACKYVRENFEGKFPKTIDELIKIPGIGRKSANVILQETMGLSQGIVVDTHVTRLSNRLGLVKNLTNAEKVESALMEKIPKSEWRFFSQTIVLHGRYICKAKKPNCNSCILNKICPSAFNFEKQGQKK